MMKTTRLGVAAYMLAVAASALAGETNAAAAVRVGPSTSPVERPSIMQVQDLAHRRVAINPAPATATTATAPARPRNTSLSTPGTYNASGLTREVFGFAPYWELASGDLSDVQYDKVSTVAYFGLTFNADGTFANDAGMTGWNSAALTSVVSQAHAAGDRVDLVVKQFDNNVICGIVGTGASGQNAIKNAINTARSRGLDGVNVDFEGSAANCNGQNNQGLLTTWVASFYQQVHAQIPGGQLTIDTYSGSASWDQGFFRIDALAPYVDAFFVMAYDMSSPNDLPNAPLGGPYTYTDATTVSQYLAKTGGDGSKVILGVPYYGYKFSTAGSGWNAPANLGAVTGCNWNCSDPYSDIVTEIPCAQQLSLHWDGPSSTPWLSWYSPASNDPCGGNHNSWRELYYDNAQSLSAKYDLVLNHGIRGTGMWALGYDHGSSDLWQALGSKFLTPRAHVDALAPTQAARNFAVSWTTDSGSPAASSYSVSVQDGAGPWIGWYSGSGNSAAFYGRPGHTYAFKIQGFNTRGPGPVPSAAQASTTVAAGAPAVTPYAGMYALDAFGGVHGVASPPVQTSAYWPGWSIARSLAVTAGGDGGVTLDGWGGVHGFGSLTAVLPGISAYWYGWDIARDVALFGDGSGGYVLDGWGGVHPFTASAQAMPPPATTSAYWRGWDIARRLVLFPDRSGGYVLDGWGGIHPFSTGVNPMPARPRMTAYWQGWDIARGIMLVPGTRSGYMLDGWGGLHLFSAGGIMPAPAAGPYWAGWDIARGAVASPGSTASNPGGWVLDGWGGVHAYGSASPFDDIAYWPWSDLARNISGN